MKNPFIKGGESPLSSDDEYEYSYPKKLKNVDHKHD